MNLKRLLLIGGGGHCKSCIDVIVSTKQYDIVGILDLPEKLGTKTLGVPVVGTDDDLPKWLDQVDEVLITVGQIRSCAKRMQIASFLTQFDVCLANVVSPFAYVGQGVSIRSGTIVMHGVTLVAGATVEENCIINTNALVEHDAVIRSFCHISTGAIVNGEATIESRSFVGSGAVVVQGVTVGADSLVGAGETIRKDVPAGYHPRQRFERKC